MKGMDILFTKIIYSYPSLRFTEPYCVLSHMVW